MSGRIVLAAATAALSVFVPMTASATDLPAPRPQLGQAQAARPAAPRTISSHMATDRVLGRANAPITIVEYVSFTCSHCAVFTTDVLPTIKRQYIDTGKARLIFRDMPTAPHQVSVSLAALGRCVPQDKFFQVADYLMGHQEEAFRSRDIGAWMRGAVALSGRTPDELQTCMSGEQLRQTLQSDVDTAASQGVNSTPSVFVNGEAASAASLEAISALIDKHLP